MDKEGYWKTSKSDFSSYRVGRGMYSQIMYQIFNTEVSVQTDVDRVNYLKALQPHVRERSEAHEPNARCGIRVGTKGSRFLRRNSFDAFQ